MPYQVPISTVPLLQDPPFVAALVVLGAAAGRRILRLFRAPSAHATPLEYGVVAAALGLGALQYLPYVLGMAGVLTKSALWIGLGMLSLLLVPDAVAVLRGAWRARRSLLPRGAPRWIVIGSAIVGGTLLAALLGALAPPTDIDGIYYQLTAPKRWLQRGDLGYLPTLLQTNLPMGVNMLFTLAMALWSDTAAKLIHFSFGVLSLFAIFCLGKRLRSTEAGFAAAALWLLGLYMVPSLDAARLFSWAYVDLAITFEIVVAALAWVLWYRSGARGWLLAAALTSGFAASFKLTGALAGSALGLMVLWVEWRRDEAPLRGLLRAAGFVAVSLLPALPWFLRSWLQTGSPVYPMLAGLLPTKDWPPEAAAAFGDYFKYYVWGTGYASSDWSLGSRKLLRAAALLASLVVTGGALYRLRDWEQRALVMLAGVFAFFCVMSTGLYVRYLLPVLPLIYVVVAARLGGRLAASRVLQTAIVLVLAVNAAAFLRAARLRSNALSALGLLSREAYVASTIPIWDLWQFVNRELPDDARVLLAAGRPSYYMDPYCFVTEAYYQARIRMDTWENFLSDLRRDGIGYVIVNETQGVPPVPGPPYAAVQNEGPFAARLAREFGQRLFASGSDHLYRLRGFSNAATPYRASGLQEHAGQ